uniref:Uncharacterized protein n=1 Tax=Eutreptiella gymnastica TaxID=73025 RepID=A0A7S1NW83_9EUGL|mmetsp:Transcript_92643/g.160541  ORF Transcript_92643/g.160541 Transcript_92643/m.160541 type:complete len:102 (+) Transcript_92643:18-323(+)
MPYASEAARASRGSTHIPCVFITTCRLQRFKTKCDVKVSMGTSVAQRPTKHIAYHLPMCVSLFFLPTRSFRACAQCPSSFNPRTFSCSPLLAQTASSPTTF